MPQRRDLARERMKQAVATLLQTESLAAITVRQIVQTAGVARSTFYRNFDDKADFLQWLQQELVAETARQFVPADGQHAPNFARFYAYAQQNRAFMRAFLTEQRWPDFVSALYATAHQRYTRLLDGRQTAVPTDTLVTFLVGGHVNLFLSWLQSEHPQAPAKMAAYHDRLGREGVMKALHVNLS
ncbi:TetR/AcrR family transcriptional regulator [Lacticaseibacillus sp. GG6-2]